MKAAQECTLNSFSQILFKKTNKKQKEDDKGEEKRNEMKTKMIGKKYWYSLESIVIGQLPR